MQNFDTLKNILIGMIARFLPIFNVTFLRVEEREDNAVIIARLDKHDITLEFLIPNNMAQLTRDGLRTVVKYPDMTSAMQGVQPYDTVAYIVEEVWGEYLRFHTNHIANG